MSNSITPEKLSELFPQLHSIKHIANGGQKSVFKAIDHEKDIVIKILHLGNSIKLQRALREIECMKRIQSENLVRLISSEQKDIDGKPVIVIIEEYIGGKTLKGIIEEKTQLGIDLALSVLECLLNLLALFEDKKIVHRDIKPDNIIISDTGKVTLLDFGIARLLDDTSITSTSSQMAPGTVPYAAPEQLLNRKLQQDIRTDMFSSGIVFFETLTGTHPFQSEEEEFDYMIVNNQKASMSPVTKNNYANILINYIYETLTAHNPSDRYRKPNYALEDINKLKVILSA